MIPCESNADSLLGLARSLLLNGQPGALILDGTPLPPPSITDELDAAMLALRLAFRAWLVRHGLTRRVSYYVSDRDARRFEIYLQCRDLVPDAVGEGYAAFGGCMLPRWIEVDGVRYTYAGVIGQSGNLVMDLAALGDKDLVYKGGIYTPV